LPDVGETCAQWSSYDRASKYDPQTGKYLHWDANGDGAGSFAARENHVVMAEMKGPGCIGESGRPRPAKDTLKIYLDDQPQPAVDLPFAD